MKYYFIIRDNELVDSSNFPALDAESVVTTKSNFDLAEKYGIDYFMYDGSKVVKNPNYKNPAEKESILSQLSDIDQSSIRSLRAISAETATEADIAKLKELEAQAQELREKLKEI